MSESELPRLTYPFEAVVSPYAEVVDGRTYRWGRDHGLFGTMEDGGHYRDARVGWLAGRTSPYSTADGLQLLADWQTWLFAFDDRFSDESARGHLPDLTARTVARYLGSIAEPNDDTPSEDIPDDDAPGGDAFNDALAELGNRIRHSANPVQATRFSHAVTGYFLAQCWEAANRSSNTVPGLAEYIRMRRHSGAVPTCLALIDIACGFFLPAEEFSDPGVVRLARHATNVACWANDILSYPKERSRSRVVHSLPVVLCEELAIGEQESLKRAAVMHDREVQRYLTHEAPVRADASPELCRYLDDLRFWMRGNLDWSLETHRYRGEEPP